MATAAYTYAPRSLAPWAEVAPGYGPVTVDLLLELPDDEELELPVIVNTAVSLVDATGALFVTRVPSTDH